MASGRAVGNSLVDLTIAGHNYLGCNYSPLEVCGVCLVASWHVALSLKSLYETIGFTGSLYDKRTIICILLTGMFLTYPCVNERYETLLLLSQKRLLLLLLLLMLLRVVRNVSFQLCMLLLLAVDYYDSIPCNSEGSSSRLTPCSCDLRSGCCRAPLVECWPSLWCRMSLLTSSSSLNDFA